MKVVLTGSTGFLGWHTRVRLRATSDHHVVAVARSSWSDLPLLVEGADAVIHVAGVNRGDPSVVEAENIELARAVVRAAESQSVPPRVVFANSTQSGNDTPYGTGKSTASDVLERYCQRVEQPYSDVVLPNLFGEHGRPSYNSFVATFAHAIRAGQPVEVVDREVELLHVQDAAAVLIDALDNTSGRIRPRGVMTSVGATLGSLQSMNAAYQGSDIPSLTTRHEVALFNTLRASDFPNRLPLRLRPRSDDRGRLVEAVRAHGGQGQTFVSSTRPGIVRGEHYHLHKVERFVVVEGTARISLRRLFSNHRVDFDVSGGEPVAVDMPTMWVHDITNTGDSDLTTLFWTNELFDPEHPDTYPERVDPSEAGEL